MGHGTRHKRHSPARTAAKIVLVLTVVIFAGAGGHFSYTAYRSGQCYTADATDSFSTETLPRKPIDSDECRQILAHTEQYQRTDATVAVLAVVLMIGAAARLSKASHRTRRVVLVAEVVGVTIGVFYTILLATALR